VVWLANIWQLLKPVLKLPVVLVRFGLLVLWKIAKGLGAFTVGVARPALRFLVFLCLIVATVALVGDATPMLNGTGPFASTAFEAHWQGLAPKSLEAARAGLETAPQAWLLASVFNLLVAIPTSVLFGLMAALAALGGRRRARLSVFTN